VIEKELLLLMKRIRQVEETIAHRYSENKMRCPTHLSIGQEAVSAAVGLALKKSDFAVSGHRAHAHYIGKGGNVPAMIAEIYGKVTGCSRGKGGSMHLVDTSVGFMGSTAIVGGTIPVGVGLGLSIQINQTQQVSCVFLGDGAVEEGAFYESANFAALKKLPVLFICENNYYSVYSHLRVRQPEGREIFEMVNAMGVPAEKCDGNDVMLVYKKVNEKIDLIREGRGPQFLEFTTYRWREHCGPNFDNNIGYRSEEEYLDWKRRDPVEHWEKHVVDSKMMTSQELKELHDSVQHEVDQAFNFAEKSEFPEPSEVFTDLYL
jgi:pyruvate dehydrogenase E1 component alpha subunit